MGIQVKENISLRKFTTFQTGGPAKYFAEAKTAQEIHHLREFARKKKIPFVILGAGSNILFLDEGYPGLIIHNKMRRMQIQGDRISVEGGVSLTKMILIAAQHNLGGLSGLTNIPGTVGGAVCGNAGVPDVCIGDVLTHAVILPAAGDKPVIVGPEYFQFGYRESKLKKNKDIVLSATLKMRMEPGVKIRAEVSHYIRERSLKQPVGNTCGSFFKNPRRFPSAGWLIDQAGCKGMKEGGAVVSPKHANFIINTGDAASKDILTLALKVHQKVKDKFNVSMQPEVCILPLSPF